MPRSCKYKAIADESISLKYILDKAKPAQTVSYNSLPAIIHLYLHDLGLLKYANSKYLPGISILLVISIIEFAGFGEMITDPAGS